VGAAIQAAVLGDEMQDMVLVDVTPLSLGIETLGDVFDILIERNTSIPTKTERTYTTASDSQSTVEVHVLQGERKQASQNKSLGRFHLTGIPPAPRGVPQIEVSFDIDANGILNVGAKDLGTGKEQSIAIKSSSGLSQEEVEAMKKEAESHAEDDKKKSELIEARNAADQMVYGIEKMLEEHADKIGDDEKKNIQDALGKLKEVQSDEDAEAIRAAMKEVEQASHTFAQKIYEQAAQQQAQAKQAGEAEPGGEAKAKPEEDIIDADFETEDKS